MKKALRYAGPLAALAACLVVAGAVVTEQHERSRRQVVSADAMRLPSESQRLMQLADTLSESQRKALFQQYNLAALFEVSEKYPEPQNGFIGPTPQRLEVVFKQVVPAIRCPGTYRAEGLVRVKGVIRPLKGVIELRQVRHAWGEGSETYTATGTFHFTQSASLGLPIATWHGLVAIDFAVQDGQIKLFLEEGAMLPVTRGIAFEGTRATAAGRPPERLIWAANFGPLGSTILAGFGPGGRSEEVAPRYRKYGWDRYWENDEWWTKSPKPKLSL